MPLRAKFITTLSSFIDQHNGGKPIELYLFLSMGKNRKGGNAQTGEELLAFIQLANRNRVLQTNEKGHVRLAIAKVRVVLSGLGLFEVYVGEDSARKADKEWVEKNAHILQRHLAPEFEFHPNLDILDWQIFTNNSLYGKALQEIKNLYDCDEKLQTMVEKVLVPAHSNKFLLEPENTEAAARAVRSYIFRESAAFLCWGGLVCYPSARFNPASEYILAQLTGKGNPAYPGSLYLGYEFRPDPTEQKCKNVSLDCRPRIAPSPIGFFQPSFYKDDVLPDLMIPDNDNDLTLKILAERLSLLQKYIQDLQRQAEVTKELIETVKKYNAQPTNPPLSPTCH